MLTSSRHALRLWPRSYGAFWQSGSVLRCAYWEVGDGRGYRVFQVRMTGNRHLADVRPVASLPATQRIADVLVLAPVDLIASKVVSLQQRQGSPKSGTDWRDLAMLLLTFPDLKRDPGPVTDLLVASGASPIVLTAWREIAAQDIRVSDEDEEFE